MATRKRRNKKRTSSFYSAHYTQGELKGLEQAPADMLSEEVELLRVAIRRAFEQACEEEAQGGGDWLKAMPLIAGGCARLANLKRAQRELNGSGSDWGSVLAAALDRVHHELGYSTQ